VHGQCKEVENQVASWVCATVALINNQSTELQE
jgi:hypothetical protein